MLGNGITFPLNKYPKVSIDDKSYEYAVMQGINRNASSLRRGSRDARGFDSSDGKGEHTHKLGALGEVAAMIYLDLDLNVTVDKCHFPDLYTRQNAPFNVKTVQNPAAGIFLPIAHVEKGYHFLIVHTPNERDFYILGYIENKDILKCPLVNPGKRLNWDGSEALTFRVELSQLKRVPAPKGEN